MKKMIIILSGFLPLSLTSYAEIGKSIEDFKNSKFAKIYSLSLHNQFKVKMFDWLEGYERKEFKGKVVFNFENPTAPSGVSIIASPDGRDILEESILIPHHFFLNEKKEKKLSAIFFILLFLEEATGGRIGTKDIEMLDEMLKEANKHGIGHPVVKKIGRCILGVNLSLIGWEFMVRKAEIGWKFVAGKVENNKKQAEYKSETSKPILNEIAKVYLKNGNVLEGKIAKETERGIYLEILDGKGKIFIRHSKIEKIERSEFSKPSRIIGKEEYTNFYFKELVSAFSKVSTDKEWANLGDKFYPRYEGFTIEGVGYVVGELTEFTQDLFGNKYLIISTIKETPYVSPVFPIGVCGEMKGVCFLLKPKKEILYDCYRLKRGNRIHFVGKLSYINAMFKYIEIKNAVITLVED